MKKAVTMIGIVFLVAALAVPAFSGGRGRGKGFHKPIPWQGHPGYCGQQPRGYDNLTEEQRAQLDTLHQKFRDDTAPIRNEIHSKGAELRSIMSPSNPDAEKARVLHKEISDLKARLAEARLNFKLEARKISPEIRLGKGYGRRHGPGMGYGPGGCWR